MRKFLLVLFILLSVYAFAGKVGNTTAEMLFTALSVFDANLAIGDPVESGNISIIPLFKAQAGFGGGSGGPKDVVYGSGVAAGIDLLPFAIVVISPEGVKVIPVINEKPFLEQLFDGLPKIVPIIMELFEKLSAAAFTTYKTYPEEVYYKTEPKQILEETPVQIPSETLTLVMKAIKDFSDIHMELMRTVEEGLAYLVLGEKGEYEEYLTNADNLGKKIEIFDNFLKVSPFAGVKSEDLIKNIKVNIKLLEDDFEAAFYDFTSSGSINKEYIIAIEDQLDATHGLFEHLEDEILKFMEKDPRLPEHLLLPEVNKGLNVLAYHLSALHGDIFSAVQEVFSYLLIPEAEMGLEEFWEEMDDAKKQIEMIRVLLNVPGVIPEGDLDKAPDMSEIEDMLSVIQQRAEKLFDKVSGGTEAEKELILEFEEIVDLYSENAEELYLMFINY